MNQWKAVLAALLPLVGLAVGIARNEIALASATEWVVPITGYDPRDPLRGHYINFRYVWRVEGDRQLCRDGGCLICLEKYEGEVVARIVARTKDAACPNRVDPQASNISPDFASRIFVSEGAAPELEKALRDGPMAVVALLRSDGILMNKRLQALPATGSE